MIVRLRRTIRRRVGIYFTVSTLWRCAMIPMPMEQVHQRASQDQQKRQRAIQVRPMFSEQEVSCNGEKSDKDPFAAV